MATEAKRKANAKYDKAHAKIYTVKLNRNTDKELIEFLDTAENKQAKFKKALKLLIEAEKDTDC